MIPGLVMAVVAAVVAASGIVASDVAPTIEVTIVNYGQPTSILNPQQPAWAHLSANAAPIVISVVVDPGTEEFRGYLATLSAPDAFQGPQTQYCSDEAHTFDVPVHCEFTVPISRGANRIDVSFHTGNSATPVEARGFVWGGELAATANIVAMEPGGVWRETYLNDPFRAPGEQLSALRYVISNTGDIPFVARNPCSGVSIEPGESLGCGLRSTRPVYALAGVFEVPIALDDPAGGSAIFSIEGAVEVPGVHWAPNGVARAKNVILAR